MRKRIDRNLDGLVCYLNLQGVDIVLHLLTSTAGFSTAVYALVKGLASGTRVAFPQEPASYPCLAAFATAEPDRVVACYVYPEEAHRLLQAVIDPTVAVENSKPQADWSNPLPSATLHKQQAAAMSEASSLTAKEDDIEFNKHVSALLLTVVEELVTIGATTRQRFADQFQGQLARVDQSYTERLMSVTKRPE